MINGIGCKTKHHLIELKQSLAEVIDETRLHSPMTEENGQNNNFYNTLYGTQNLDKQIQDVLLANDTLE